MINYLKLSPSQRQHLKKKKAVNKKIKSIEKEMSDVKEKPVQFKVWAVMIWCFVISYFVICMFMYNLTPTLIDVLFFVVTMTSGAWLWHKSKTAFDESKYKILQLSHRTCLIEKDTLDLEGV